jgi:hypothetical protein
MRALPGFVGIPRLIVIMIHTRWVDIAAESKVPDVLRSGVGTKGLPGARALDRKTTSRAKATTVRACMASVIFRENVMSTSVNVGPAFESR